MNWTPFRHRDSAQTAINAKAANRCSKYSRRQKNLRIESLENRIVLAAPVAFDNTYSTLVGAPLNVPAAGVLANDTDADGDTMRAVLADNVDHGTLNLAPDGSFTYTPNPGFTGTDTFTYRAVTDPPMTFTVDPAQSSVNVTATVHVADVGSRTDSDTTRLTGTVLTKLSPTSTPFASAQVLDMDLTLADPLSFSFNFIVANLTANAAAGSMHVTMETPGAPATVTNGNFVQTANDLRVTGEANLACSSILNLCPELPPNPQVFDNAGIITDIQGTLSQTDSTVTLTFPVNFVGSFDLGDGNSLDLTLAGSVRATAQASPPAEQSYLGTVTITTLPEVDANGETYHVREDGTLAVSAAALPRTDVLMPRGSLWKFLANGSDQGTAWREAAYDDSAWTGPVEGYFGYGEGDEGTVIPCDPAPASCADNLNDNFITSYFRREIYLDQVDDIRELLVRMRRDDGAAVYINGVPVARDNLAAAAVYNTPALGVAADDGDNFHEFSAPASMLVVGTNVIAVEVHQSDGNSSDVTFDLELAARRGNLGLLANDRNNVGGSLAVTIETQPAHGTLLATADGGFTYTPAANYAGPDSFTYRVSPTVAPVTASIVVDPVDDAPTAVADGPYNATVGTPLTIAASGVLANDSDLEGDALSALLYSGAELGTLTLNPDGGFTYTALAAGSDQFAYRAAQNTTLVPLGARWKFLDNGTDQGVAWQASAFDDSAWSAGVAELGYGDGDEANLVGYGKSASGKYLTTYFRHAFEVTDRTALVQLVLNVIRDDGVAVYLNGTEIGRDNLPAGALFNTPAGPLTIGDAAETTPVTFNVPANLLVDGTNVLAVEVHQQSGGSSDMSFDLRLTGTLLSAPTTVAIESTGGSTTGPRVNSVEVQSTAWTTAFRDYLSANDLGVGGYAIPGGAGQLATLPWTNLGTIAVNFTDLVDPASLAGATLVGATVGNVPLGAPLTSSGPGGTTFAIWNLPGGASLAADQYTLTLAGAATTGGAALDGEWTTDASAFPSGDGTAGGTFAFEFRVMPGDVNRDATVNLADVAANVTGGFRATADASYSPYNDVNGNGIINVVDTVLVRNQLPIASPSPAAAAVVVSAQSTPSRAASIQPNIRAARRAVDALIATVATGNGENDSLGLGRDTARRARIASAVGEIVEGIADGSRPRGRANTRSAG
jgi:hypothetical protein